MIKLWQLLTIHVDDNRNFSLADLRSAWSKDHQVADPYPGQYISQEGPVPVKRAGPDQVQAEHYWRREQYIYGSLAARAVCSRSCDDKLLLIARWESPCSITCVQTTDMKISSDFCPSLIARPHGDRTVLKGC